MRFQCYSHRVALVGALFLLVGPCRGASFFLDFDDGQLPSAHGFVYASNPVGLAEGSVFSVSGGSLFMNTLAIAGENQASYNIANGYDSANPMTLEFRMRIFGSQSAGAGGVYGQDSAIAWSLYVGSGHVAVHRDLPAPVDLFFPIDTSVFHVYRATVVNGIYSAFIDGNLIFAGPANGTQPCCNLVLLGDGTAGGDASWELDYISYANDAAVPEPATGAIGGVVLFALALRKKYARCVRQTRGRES